MTFRAKGRWSRAILLMVILGLSVGLIHSHPSQFGRTGSEVTVDLGHTDHNHGHGSADHSMASAHCSYCLELGGKLYFAAPESASFMAVENANDFILKSTTLSSAAVRGLFRPPIVSA